MLTHNFLDKLEMTLCAVISSLSRIAADYHNELNYIKSSLVLQLWRILREGFLRQAQDKFRGKPAAQRGLATLRLRSG